MFVYMYVMWVFLWVCMARRRIINHVYIMVALSMVLLYYKRSVRAFLFTKQLQHRYTTFCAPTTAIAECVLATKFAECILATKKKHV